MKTHRILWVSFLSTLLLLLTVRCSDDDPAPLLSISGTVTYPGISGNTAAGGSVVLLAKTANALEYNFTSIADASGNYIFDNLEAGTYYLNANYYTDNQNLGARLEGVNFNAGDDIEVVIGGVDVTENITLVSVGQTMASAMDINYDGREGGAGNATEWEFDPNHTTVDFAFDFKEENSEFTGSFGRVTKLILNLDPASLSTSSLMAEVDLMSVNTRTRGGRDPLWDGEFNALTESTVFTETNCIATTFGIFADATFPATVTDPQRYASFTSTSVEPYGDGFIAKGNLSFSAVMSTTPSSPYGITNNPNTMVTKAAQIVFKYRTGTEDATRFYASFEGKMIMNAKADFNIFSSNIVDEPIKVYVNIQLRKNK
ncbi:MAG TPA: YceI family protein [Cyclobacteriaceae bacterium]|jgi:hypothetical protein